MQDNDLISRAAARDVINTWGRLATEDVRMDLLHHDLNALPAVDAVPVKHGRWIYKERHRKSYRQYTGYDAVGDIHTVTVLEETCGKEPYCSECGAQAAESYMDFCPHCGAKMDGSEP